MKGYFDVTIMTVGKFGYAEHLLEESIVVAGDGGTPFIYVGKVAFSFGFAFLPEPFCGLAVFFLMAFLPLLQTVVARFQKHFIDFIGIDFDPDVAVGHGGRFSFQDQKSVLDFVQFVDLLIVQSVNIVFIVWGHYIWFENDYL